MEKNNDSSSANSPLVPKPIPQYVVQALIAGLVFQFLGYIGIAIINWKLAIFFAIYNYGKRLVRYYGYL